LIYRKLGILRWLNRGARQIVGAPQQQVTIKEKPQVQAAEKINKVYPGREHIPLFQSHTSISIEKAAKELGYKPKFNLDSGTKLTRSWLEWANNYN
jgi:nucleoside-diphosphate-sugar epimerase